MATYTDPPLPPDHPDLHLPLPKAQNIEITDPKDFKIDLLLMVVTQVEFRAVIRKFKPLPGRTSILRGVVESNTYILGVFGVYRCALAQCEMGGGGAHGSTLVADRALRFWHPKALIMIGIAFGLLPQKQNYGDVLVSQQLADYDLQRVASDVTQRGNIQPSGHHLSPHFAEMSIYDWDFADRKVHRGLLVSGQQLVDSAARAQELLAAYRTAVGGEMEGHGLSASSIALATEWIVVKGICDFAGLTGAKSKEAQPFAAAAATSLVLHVLEQHILGPLGCTYIDPNQSSAFLSSSSSSSHSTVTPPSISDSSFHNPEFIRLASDSASQDSQHASPHGAPAVPFSSSQLPTCSSSQPRRDQSQNSHSAHRQIKQAAFEFNQRMKAPRTGVTAADVALWSFSAGIQPSSDVVHFLKTQFDLIRPQILNTFEEMCKDMPQVGEFPFEFKLEARQGGSVANQTYLTSPDLDIYLVINSTRSLKTLKGENNQLQYGSGEIAVTDAMVTLIVSACAAAMEQFLNNQDGLFSLTATDFVSDGMTVFTLKESIERFEGLQLEFDVVPVLQVIGGKFLMLSKDGTLKPTSTELAAHTIGVYSAQFPGLREMMVVLKLVHKAGIKQQLASLSQVPSCALEMVMLLLVKQKRERAAVWWKASSFTDIFKEAISELLKCIQSGDPLPAPNNPNDDLLMKIRGSPSEFVEYYSGWFQIEESTMLGKLKACLSQVVSPSNP